ncbi:uncharacterized protein LOC115415754 [Sphaeramia orbicularis]|uniref:uncharacterized protein LOC115415754 n=1 Tax=Sphaeramia orbicularis TaxID=375764 RepID=UPI00117BE4AD|nr:uncharacterized protein LOC115415754 [Sphaeramia orbicularis]
MGCSPSKGKLFTKPGPQNGLLVEELQDSVDSRPTDGVNQHLKSEEKEIPLPTTEHMTSEPAWVSSDETDATNAAETEETKGNGMPQEILSEVLKTDEIKRTQRSKKHKANRKQRKSSIIKTKVDFPPQMVRAHQAAYTFLNPSISKFETLLGLLDQAAQTQLSLQPMMSALVLRFEEINQALEEMAEEGELMLKEHGDYMVLPSGMIGPKFMAIKANTETSGPPDPPPDLLQQLLQHSTEKMRHVGTSFQVLGDNTLEDAVEYFTSLAKLLVGKMRDKQVAEQRIVQVLARVEQATTRKSNPEDSALHSEDSGIGGENESLTGSERHRRHRGSAGSGSCGSGINFRGVLDNQPSNSLNLMDNNEYDEGDEEEEEDDDDENVDDEDGRQGRKRSNSSPPDPSQTLLYMRAKYMRNLMLETKRPLTAAAASNKPEALSAARCANSVMELRKSQRDLEGRMKKIQGNREIEGPHYNLYRAGLRRHSISGSGGAHKGPLKTNQLCTLPVLAPQTPKRPSVRRLINTFSQGVDGRPGQSLVNIPPHIKRPRKSGILPLSNIANSTEGFQVNNGNNNNNSWPDGKDDCDVDNLPPPAPEVLMDNSFKDSEGNPTNDSISQEGVVQGLPIINQKCGLSHRLRTSMQNMEVLPNRASIRSRSNISSVSPVRQDAEEEEQQESGRGQETEKTSCVYQQAQRIIPLHHATESVEKRQTGEQSGQRGSSPLQSSHALHESDMSRSSPVTAPPVSRVRLPPSCPSVRHRFPSPPVCRHPSSSSRPSSRPSSPRTVTRASESTAEEITLSMSFHDARSVFCQNETQNSQPWTSSGASVLPRPWGDTFRGRLSTRGMDNSSRRTQSEQRPSLTSYSEDGLTASTQATWKEQITTNQSSVTTPDNGWSNQSTAATTHWD